MGHYIYWDSRQSCNRSQIGMCIYAVPTDDAIATDEVNCYAFICSTQLTVFGDDQSVYCSAAQRHVAFADWFRLASRFLIVISEELSS